MYDPGAVDRIQDRVEALDYEGDDGNCRYRDRRPVLAIRDATDIVLGYSVTHSIAGKEEMRVSGRDDPDGYETALAMLDAAWDPDRGAGAVDVHLPDDTAALLCATIPDSDHAVRRYVSELHGATTPLPIDRFNHVPDSGGTGKTSAEHYAAHVAAGHLDGTPVIATYNWAIHEDVEDMGAVPAAPWQVLEALTLSEGPYAVPEVNRVANMLDRYTEPTAYRDTDVEGIPSALQQKFTGTPDVVVPDHSVTTEIAKRQRRFVDDTPVHTWQHALRAIDAAVADEQVTVYLPDNSGERMAENIGNDVGNAVREDIEAVTEPLPLDLDAPLPPELGEVSEAEREAMREDYAIAAAAVERSDVPPLVLSYDGDFAEMEGVIGREPATFLASR